MNKTLNETFQKHLELLKNKLNENETQTELFNFGTEPTVLELIKKLEEHEKQLDALLDQIHETVIRTDGYSDITKVIKQKSEIVMDGLFSIINELDNRYGKK